MFMRVRMNQLHPPPKENPSPRNHACRGHARTGFGRIALIGLILLASIGCQALRFAPTQSAQSLSAALDLKIRSHAITSQAVQSYSAHAEQIDALQLDLDSQRAVEAVRPANMATVKQWDTLLDPKGALLGWYLAEWKTRGTMPPDLVRYYPDVIDHAFDSIRRLEMDRPPPKP